MTPMKPPILLSSLLALAAACSSGGGGGDPTNPNAPTVTAIAFPETPGGLVPVTVTVAHPVGQPTDVQLEVSYDGTTWCPAARAWRTSTARPRRW